MPSPKPSLEEEKIAIKKQVISSPELAPMPPESILKEERKTSKSTSCVDFSKSF